MVWGALGALCSVVASCVAVIGDPPPRTWGVDAWYEVAIDAKTPALADAPFALPEGETTRALRLELPPDLPRPCTIEVRAPWFDAALVARDGAGAALGFDDDGWYGVHPALALDDTGASAARSIDVVALHDGRGTCFVRVRAGGLEALDVGERSRRVLAEAQEQFDEARAQQDRIDASRFAALLRTTLIVRQVGADDVALRLARDAVQLARAIAGEASNEVRLALEQQAEHETWRGAYDDAQKTFEEAHRLAVAEFGGADPRVASTLRKWGQSSLAAGRLTLAREQLQRAVELLAEGLGPEHVDTLATLEWLAQVDAKLGNYGLAEVAFRRILELREKRHGDGDVRTIDAMHNLASTLYAAGDPAAARPLLARALELTERLTPQDPLAVAVTARELAGVLYQLGDYRGAEPLAERAYALFSREVGEDSTHAAGALRDRALIAEVLGDSERARIWFQRCVAIRERVLGPTHPELASDLATLAGLLRRNGSPAAGMPLIERALAIHVATFGDDHAEVASDHLIAAEIVRELGDLRAAEAHVLEALRIREATFGATHAHVAAALALLGGVLRDQGRSAQARDVYARALDIDVERLGEGHPSTLATMNDLALAEHDLGHLDAASALVRRGLAIAETTQDRVDLEFAGAVQNLALIDVDLGRFDSAREHGKRAFELATAALDLVARQGSEGHRLAQLRRLRWHLAAYLTWCGLEAGHEAEAYEAVLRWKDLAFFAARGPARRTLAEVAPMLDRQAELADAVFVDASVDVWARDQRLAAALNAVVAAESAQAIQASVGPRDGAIEELAAALPEGAVLVDLVIRASYQPLQQGGTAVRGRHIEPVVTAFVLAQGRSVPRRVELGSAATLRARLDAVLRSIALHDDADGRDGAWVELESVLLEPLRSALGKATRLIVVPDDFLVDVPWDALELAPDKFLVEQMSVTLLPAATRLADALHAGPIAATTMLAVADVAYEAAEGAPPTRGTRPAGFPALPGTARELELVRTRFASAASATEQLRALRGVEATKQAVRAQVEGARILHFATHAFARPTGLAAIWEQPIGEGAARVRSEPNAAVDLLPGLLTGLVLAGANDPPGNDPAEGLLTAAEAAWLPLAECELVVLSACGSARGTSVGGDSLASLQRAFHLAGANAVVSTLWDLGDAAACEWIDAFYQALWNDRLPVAEAARAAKLKILAEQRAAGQVRPGDWAVFVVSE